MSDSITAYADDCDRYTALCEKYGHAESDEGPYGEHSNMLEKWSKAKKTGKILMSKIPDPDKFPETPTGAWVAYYADGSVVGIFRGELEALRYAVSRGMLVEFVEYGKEIGS